MSTARDLTNSTKVFEELREKFSSNLKTSLTEKAEELHQVETKARAFAVLGQIISEDQNLSKSQKDITAIFDEIFADIVTSIYLAGCSLDKPAQLTLRRALELGIAAIYLWDNPAQFWGWKCHDKDLSFKEMIDYLNSDNYKSFIVLENLSSSNSYQFDVSQANKLYRILSNTIHGKITTFETVLPDCFNFNSNDWSAHLELVLKVENLLFGLWENRFEKAFLELEIRLPSLRRFR